MLGRRDFDAFVAMYHDQGAYSGEADRRPQLGGNVDWRRRSVLQRRSRQRLRYCGEGRRRARGGFAVDKTSVRSNRSIGCGGLMTFPDRCRPKRYRICLRGGRDRARCGGAGRLFAAVFLPEGHLFHLRGRALSRRCDVRRKADDWPGKRRAVVPGDAAERYSDSSQTNRPPRSHRAEEDHRHCLSRQPARR